jgi:hypothetical protein
VRGDGRGILGGFERHFGSAVPLGRRILNVWSVSCVSLLAVLLVYVAATPGFWTSLAAGGPGLRLLLRQVLTNGLPVVFLVNLAGFLIFGQVARSGGRGAGLAGLALDLPIRAALFLGLHAVVYAGSARLFGSFGGDPVQALEVVGPTLARSAVFGNLSGVYLYASGVSLVALVALAARPAGIGPAATLGLAAGWTLLVAAAISGLAALI